MKKAIKHMYKLIHLVLLLALVMILPAATASAYAGDVFSDIAGHWGYTNITRAAELGFVSGLPDGTFAPDRPISRGEFISLAVRAQKIEAGTASGHWAARFLVAGQKAGIIPAYYTESHEFLDEKIQRIEAVQLLATIAEKNGMELNAPPKEFSDTGALSDEDMQALEIVVRAGIMRGNGDMFMPYKTTTRAEIATIFVNIARASENTSSAGAATGYAAGDTYVADAAHKTFDINDDIAWQIIRPLSETGGDACFVIVSKADNKVMAVTVPILPEGATAQVTADDYTEYTAGGRTYWVYRSKNTDDAGLEIIALEINPRQKRALSEQIPTDTSGFEKAADYITNVYRCKKSLQPCEFLNAAQKFALRHTQNMKKHNFFDHNGPGSTTFSTRLQSAGIDWIAAGENIAYGYNNPISLVVAWVNSPGHRANLVGDFKYACTAVLVGGGTQIIATQFFVSLTE